METLQNIGILDLVFFVVLGISVALGLVRGAVREVLSLVGLAASVYFAFNFADDFSKDYVSKFIEDPSVSYIVTFVLIIVVTLFAVTLINLFARQLLKASGLSLLNRVAGGVFGILRGAIICSILVMILGFIPGVTSKSWWQSSSLAPFFTRLTKTTFQYLPNEVSNYIGATKDRVNKAAGELAIPDLQTPETPQAPQTPENAQPQQTAPVNNSGNGDNSTSKETDIILQSVNESYQDSNNDTPQSAPQSNDSDTTSGIVLESIQ